MPLRALSDPGGISLHYSLGSRIGIKLFQRTPNKLLTDAGRAFLINQRLLRDFERGVTLVRGGNTGSIVVTSGNDIAQFLTRIAAFLKDNPLVNMSILTRSSPIPGASFGGQSRFRYRKFSIFSRSISRIRLFTSGIVPSTQSLRYKVKQVSLRDLVGYGLIVLPKTPQQGAPLKRYFGITAWR
jgi:hypothetical protein